MVEIEKNYEFEGPDGTVALIDVTIDASRGFDIYNYRTLDEYAAIGQESMKTAEQPYDMPGQSCFLRMEGHVFHTYSQYARGLESTALLLFPRPHRPRPPRGLGRAEEPQPIRSSQHARLRVVTPATWA